jgi:P4 family phage/plasmid primase-like protien
MRRGAKMDEETALAEALKKTAIYQRKMEVPDDKIIANLLFINKNQLKPLAEESVIKIFEESKNTVDTSSLHDSLHGITIYIMGCKNVREISKEQARQEVYEFNKKQPNPIEKSKIEKLLDEVYKGEELLWFEKGKFIPKNLGDYIMERHTFKTIPNTRSDTIYVYQNGVYKNLGESIIRRESNAFLEKKTKTNFVNEATGYIARSTYIFPEQINQDPYLINLKNGFYNLKEKKLLPHNPEIFSITQLPIYYNPEADCPLIKKFVSEIVTERDVDALQELVGYCLWKDYHIQKAFMFLGEGHNGKSTFIKTLSAFMGTENISAIPLQDLEQSFAKATLYGKMANLYPDISSKALTQTGTFKALTGGDAISAEFKFKDRFSFTNFAKLIFSCNKIPETRDFTTAFFRRWVIVNFPYKFEGKNDDKFLINKLTIQEELSGMFNWALEGLERLLQTGDFSNSKTAEEMEIKYKKLSSSVAGFVTDCCQTDTDAETRKEELYLAYCNYCRESQLIADSKDVFYKKLPIYAEHIKDVRSTVGGRRTLIIKGIKLREWEKEKINIENFLQ